MKFQIVNIKSDGREFNLSQECYNEENVFTIITGKNSSGKSRLLSKVVNSFIFSKDDSVLLARDSIEYPKKVIAISTGRFDKFPLYVHAAKNKNFKNNYFYHGVKANNNFPSATLTKGVASIFYGMNVNHGILKRLSGLFGYLGFSSMMEINFSINVNMGKLRSSNYVEFYNDYVERNRFKDPTFVDRLNKYQKNYPHLEDFVNNISGYIDRTQNNYLGKSFYLKLDFEDENIILFKDLEHLLPLIELNVVQVKDIRVISKKEKSKISLFQTSSGQQCMVLMMIGIVSSISDNSLVCIDEPEISLHPKWQLEFISILQRTFSDYKGCHFLLATHSPQIISGLKANNGYILSLENDELTSSEENSLRSADYQLAEVFDAPGYRNEYITKLSIDLFARIKKNKKIDENDKLSMSKLKEFKKNIEAEDPVYELIETLEEVFDYYG